jgi:hypothetical protein
MGATEVIDTSIKIYRRNWKTLMGLVAAVIVPLELLHQILYLTTVHTVTVTGTTYFLTRSDQTAANTITAVFGLLDFLVVAPFLAGTMARATAELYMGNVPDFGGTMRFALSRLGAILWVTILFTLSVIGGTILFVIPGIIFWVRLCTSSVVVVVEDVRGSKALGRSWRLTRGHSWRVFGTQLLAVVLVGVVSSIITVPFSLGGLQPGLLGALLRFLAATIGAILTRPFLALVTTLIYFDLRIRKEGLDLAIMARDLGSSPSAT